MNYFDIREEAETEIHSFKASWFLKWGVTVVFVIIGIIIYLSYIIKYPDVITGQATLTSAYPPSTIVATEAIRVDSLCVSDGSLVQNEDYLLFYNSTARYKHVVHLKKQLKTFTSDKEYLINLFLILKDMEYNLGTIQSSYFEFVNVLYEYYNLHKTKPNILKIADLRKQVAIQEKLLSHYRKIQKTTNKELNIVRNREQVDSSLFNKSVIDKFTYYTSIRNKLNQENGMQSANVSYTNIQLQISRIETNINNLQLQRQEALMQIPIKISYAFSNLMKTINAWENKFTVKAPINGKLSFLSFVRQKNMVAPGDRLFTITPLESNYEVQLKFPLQGASKVKSGQTVRVKLQDIPYKESGYLECTIKSISQASNEDHYIGIAKPNNRLITTYNKQIHYKENMIGNAEIVTNNRSILERMVEKIIYVFQN